MMARSIFVNSRRIREFLPRLRTAQIELHSFSSLVNRVLRTPLAFDVLILRQRKAIQDYETDTWNIARRRSWVSDDALDPGSARSTNSVGDISSKCAFEFLRSLLAAALRVFAPSRTRVT